MKKIFAPGNDSTLTSAGLLVLRLWLGLTMLLHHGLDKLAHFDKMAPTFFDPLHIGSKFSLGLVIFAEVIGAALLVIGLLTRFAALVLIIDLGVAFFLFHKEALSGATSGELAFVYLAGFVALFISNAGKFSLDKSVFGKKGQKQSGTV